MSKAEQNGQTQSGPKHREKSSDLRRHMKTVSDVDEVTLDGRLFHTREAATGNERSPMVEWYNECRRKRRPQTPSRVYVRHSVEFISEIWRRRRMQAKHRTKKNKNKKDNYLVEVVESLVEVGHHASRRFVRDLDGHFENALRYAVSLT